jgi:hypothetical protein
MHLIDETSAAEQASLAESETALINLGAMAVAIAYALLLLTLCGLLDDGDELRQQLRLAQTQAQVRAAAGCTLTEQVAP